MQTGKLPETRIYSIRNYTKINILVFDYEMYGTMVFLKQKYIIPF